MIIDQITKYMTTIIRSEDLLERESAFNALLCVFNQQIRCNDDKSFLIRNKLLYLIGKSAKTKNAFLRSLKMIRASWKLRRLCKCDIRVIEFDPAQAAQAMFDKWGKPV